MRSAEVLRRIAKVHNHSLKAPRIACNRVSSCRCAESFVCRARGSVVCQHGSCEVKARVRARGTRGQNWYGEKKVNFIRSRVRTQNSWLLHLAGDHHMSYESKQTLHRAHLMRCMLSANLVGRLAFLLHVSWNARPGITRAFFLGTLARHAFSNRVSANSGRGPALRKRHARKAPVLWPRG